MWVLLYLVAIIAILLVGQTIILRAFGEPLKWTYGATSEQSKSLKLALKVLLQTTLVGSIFLFPYLVGRTAGSFYGPLFPRDQFYLFLYGEGIALLLLSLIYGIELAGGWLKWEPRWSTQKKLSKSGFSALSSLTVVAVEEPFFRGIILQTMLLSQVPALVAIPVSAVVFSLAHFIRKVRTYWPAVGLAVLGLWLGVAYYKTGSLWLPMGLHSGGILSIGIHRCFTRYAGPEWLIGTQTFPIAGMIAIVIMLIGTAVTYWIF